MYTRTANRADGLRSAFDPELVIYDAAQVGPALFSKYRAKQTESLYSLLGSDSESSYRFRKHYHCPLRFRRWSNRDFIMHGLQGMICDMIRRQGVHALGPQRR